MSLTAIVHAVPEAKLADSESELTFERLVCHPVSLRVVSFSLF